MRALLRDGQRVKQAPQGEEVRCVLQGTWRFFLAPCILRSMTEDLDRWHVLISSVVCFIAGASAVYLRIWLHKRFLRDQEELQRRRSQ